MENPEKREEKALGRRRPSGEGPNCFDLEILKL